jgi:LCP family protein required for cell wall assembly
LPLVIVIVSFLTGYFLAPGRTNVLVLGVDARDPGSALGRTDTNILVTILPQDAYVGMVSIPRDLWVSIPGYGENRINAAHFFAEGEEPGSGPLLAMATVKQNFNVPIQYYVLVQFDSLRSIVDSLGGITVDLPRPMSRYNAGSQRMDGEMALAFVRDRQGSDDFFRMERGQLFLNALIEALLSPQNWVNWPKLLRVQSDAVDSNIPFWIWPRLAFTVFRARAGRIDGRTITRQMAQPSTTPSGAAILIPNWSLIDPLVEEMFGNS